MVVIDLPLLGLSFIIVIILFIIRGLGVGIFSRDLWEYGKVSTDLIELCPQLVDLAKKYFYYRYFLSFVESINQSIHEVVDKEIILSLLLILIIGCSRETGRVWIGDGRAVIFNDLAEDHQYDYILHDIFSGNNWLSYSILYPL